MRSDCNRPRPNHRSLLVSKAECHGRCRTIRIDDCNSLHCFVGRPQQSPILESLIPAATFMMGSMDLTTESAERLSNLVEQLKINKIRRHIFLCADQTKPECASKEEGLASWNYLK